jgi:hypothetical protein
MVAPAGSCLSTILGLHGPHIDKIATVAIAARAAIMV